MILKEHMEQVSDQVNEATDTLLKKFEDTIDKEIAKTCTIKPVKCSILGSGLGSDNPKFPDDNDVKRIKDGEKRNWFCNIGPVDSVLSWNIKGDFTITREGDVFKCDLKLPKKFEIGLMPGTKECTPKELEDIAKGLRYLLKDLNKFTFEV